MIFHIDFNSYFATVEQQANPRLRGKPIGVTGGDRLKRTVLGAASVEAKKFGVKTGMLEWEAKKLCPQIILVKGDSDKYLECTKRFLAILKDYSPYLEVFSIDEVFLKLTGSSGLPKGRATEIAQQIKARIKAEIGEYITCSIGISYNKLMAKLAGSLYKPDGLVVIADTEAAQWVLDRVELDEICGIGPRIKKRLNNMGVFNFAQLRKAPLAVLLASFKSYGQVLYNYARGIDHTPVIPFYEKEEVKSIGHRHTIDHDTNNSSEIKQILLKLTELVARRLRAKKLVGKTVSCWYRSGLNPTSHRTPTSEVGFSVGFSGGGMQVTIHYTNDGLDIFKAAWRIFNQLWYQNEAPRAKSPRFLSENASFQVSFIRGLKDHGFRLAENKIRMIGVSISNLKPILPQNLSLCPAIKRQEIIIKTLDKINDKYGEFTLSRAILLGGGNIRRKPNPYLSDRRFKI